MNEMYPRFPECRSRTRSKGQLKVICACLVKQNDLRHSRALKQKTNFCGNKTTRLPLRWSRAMHCGRDLASCADLSGNT